MTTRTLYLAFSNPVEGKDEEYEAWYRDVHVPDLLAMPEIVSAQRFALADCASNGGIGSTPRYLVVYEMEGDVDEVMLKIAESVGAGSIVVSDALDMGSVAMSFWTPLGPRGESGYRPDSYAG
jgi:hypothetical protein